jgi:hypothetical protein
MPAQVRTGLFALALMAVPCVAGADALDARIARVSLDYNFTRARIAWERCIAAGYFEDLERTNGNSADPTDVADRCQPAWNALIERARQMEGQDPAFLNQLAARVGANARRMFPAVSGSGYPDQLNRF